MTELRVNPQVDLDYWRPMLFIGFLFSVFSFAIAYQVWGSLDGPNPAQFSIYFSVGVFAVWLGVAILVKSDKEASQKK